jgi:hypothetical protein
LSKSGNSLREAMQALSREELKGAEHPPASRLIAYQRGEIEPAQAAAIRQHLSLCTECAELVLDSADFFGSDAAAEGEEEESGPAGLEARWEELQAALRNPELHPPSPAPSPASMPAAATAPPPPRRSLVRSLAFAYSLAATFAAIALGLLLSSRFKEPGAPPPRPQANVGLYDLTSAASERAGSGQVTAIRFRSPGDSALLILNPAVAARSARYGVRIRSSGGAVAWRSEELVPQPTGAFHLGLPAGALRPGRYSVELYGTAGGRETLLGSYPIAVEN